MRPLPNTDYEAAVWTSNLKVGSDYLVSDGLNKYSVPFDLIGETVNLRLTPNAVEVFYRGTRVAMHVRSRVGLDRPGRGLRVALLHQRMRLRAPLERLPVQPAGGLQRDPLQALLHAARDFLMQPGAVRQGELLPAAGSDGVDGRGRGARFH